jgi:hypothetical protein
MSKPEFKAPNRFGRGPGGPPGGPPGVAEAPVVYPQGAEASLPAAWTVGTAGWCWKPW